MAFRFGSWTRRKAMSGWPGSLALALVVALALAACGKKGQSLESGALAQTRAREAAIDEVIQDESKKAEAKRLLEQLDREIRIFYQQFAEAQNERARLGVSYDTKREQMEEINERARVARLTRADRLVELAAEARAMFSAEEWRALAEARAQAYAELKGD